MLKRILKNEKGLTLIELLAVVVILGIIAAIAVPSIGGLIDNSKRDAHIANAQQIANAAKTYIAATNVTIAASGSKEVTLDALITGGYLDEIKDPNGDSTNPRYDKTGTKVVVKNTTSTSGGTTTSTGYKYYVTLKGAGTSGKTYISQDGSTNTVDAVDLKRDNVTLP